MVRPELSLVAIAGAVERMVSAVLGKDYSRESCMAFLSNNRLGEKISSNGGGDPAQLKLIKKGQDIKDNYANLISLCIDVISKGIEKAIARIDSDITAQYVADESTQRIRAVLKADANFKKILRVG